MRELHDFPGGLRLEPRKEITDQKPSLLHPLPERMFLPLQQHIGLPAEPLVKPGDKVLKGQMVAQAGGYVSVPVHAGTSGKIIGLAEHPVPHPSLNQAPCIVLEPDGEDAWFDIRPTERYDTVEPRQLQKLIRDCGIAGLGGAGFPAHVKLMEGVDNAVDTLIINGVECEPHITCDARLIQEKASYVVSGARMIRHAVQAAHCVIAVEEDMPAAYEALAALVDDDLELVKVPVRYPAGGEKQLIKTLTGREVPSGGLPIHIGIVIHNVATAAAVFRAVTRGEPIVSRYVTVTGRVENPVNLQVLNRHAGQRLPQDLRLRTQGGKQGDYRRPHDGHPRHSSRHAGDQDHQLRHRRGKRPPAPGNALHTVWRMRPSLPGGAVAASVALAGPGPARWRPLKNTTCSTA